jgi:hypothetical protein
MSRLERVIAWALVGIVTVCSVMVLAGPARGARADIAAQRDIVKAQLETVPRQLELQQRQYELAQRQLQVAESTLQVAQDTDARTARLERIAEQLLALAHDANADDLLRITQRLLAVAQQLEQIARRTEQHARNLDRKTGPALVP